MNQTSSLLTAQARQVIDAVCRHSKMAIWVFVGIMAMVAAATYLLPKTYQSEGKLFVRLGRENATLDPTASLGQDPVVAIPYSRDNDINSVAEILQSRPLLESVVNAMGPAMILEQGDVSNGAASTDALHERAIQSLAKTLKVAPIRRSNIVQVSCTAHSPELAQKILAKHLDLFQDEYIHLNRPPEVHAFFVKQTERLHAELIRKEEQLRDLKTSTGLSSLTEQRRAVVARIGRLQDDLLDVEASRAATQGRVKSLRAQLTTLPETRTATKTSGIGNEGTDRIREQFYALQIRKEEAAAKYTENHPAMQQINRQIAEAREIMSRQEATRTQVTTATNRPFEEAQIALLKEEPLLASLEAKATSLRAQLAEVRNEQKKFNEQELQIAQLTRDVELLTANYRKYAGNLEQARVDHALEAKRMSNISVVQPATFEPRPIRPSTRLNLALGLLVASLGSVGLALIKDGRERLSSKGLENGHGIPVLGSVPYLPRRPSTANGNGSDVMTHHS